MKQSNLARRPRATRRVAGHAQQDHILDPYPNVNKSCMTGRSARSAAPSVTRGAGRWMARAEGAFEALCTACRRINDKFPAVS